MKRLLLTIALMVVAFPAFGATRAAGIAYLVANVLDTQEVTGGVPQVDSNNNPVMVSFFAGSTATTASN